MENGRRNGPHPALRATFPQRGKAGDEVCKRALEVYGSKAQICMVFEETAELQKELCKNLRGKDNIEHIAEEIADVKIMLRQMELLFSCGHSVNAWIEKKLERLRERLDNRT